MDEAVGEFRIDFGGTDARERAESSAALLAALPPDAAGARAAAFAELTAARITLAPGLAGESARAASAVAAESGDDIARAYALVATNLADLSAATIATRTESARDALRLAVATGHRRLVPAAFFLLLGALTEAADVAAIDRLLAVRTTSLGPYTELLEGRHATWFRCMRATLDGRALDARRLADAGLAIAESEGDPDARRVWAAQRAVVGWMRGRLAIVEPIVLRGRQDAPDEPVWNAAIAATWTAQGRGQAVAGLLAGLPPIDDIPRDRNRLAALALLSEPAVRHGDDDLVEALHDALLPYADRFIGVELGVTCGGTVARPLAVLARRRGDTAQAIEHYWHAIDGCARVGAQVWLAQAQFELAGLLRDSGGDPGEARNLAWQASATAGQLGLTELDILSTRLLDEIGTAGTAAPDAAARETPPPRPPRIRVLGEFSVHSADGSRAHWRSRKAARLLKILLARRGAATPRDLLLELLWPDLPPAALANRFAVAVSTVRAALDHRHEHPRDHYLTVDPQVVALRLDHLTVDVEDYLAHLAETRAELDRADDPRALPDATLRRLTEALGEYPGPVLPDEPYSDWCDPLRRAVESRYLDLAHALAAAHAARDAQRPRVDLYRRILALDGYDGAAHEGLVDALERTGAAGQAQAAREQARQRLGEIEGDAS